MALAHHLPLLWGQRLDAQALAPLSGQRGRAQLLEAWLPGSALSRPRGPNMDRLDPPGASPGLPPQRPRPFAGKRASSCIGREATGGGGRLRSAETVSLPEALPEPEGPPGPVRRGGRAATAAGDPSHTAYQRQQLPGLDGDGGLQGPRGGEGPAAAAAALERPGSGLGRSRGHQDAGPGEPQAPVHTWACAARVLRVMAEGTCLASAHPVPAPLGPSPAPALGAAAFRLCQDVMSAPLLPRVPRKDSLSESGFQSRLCSRPRTNLIPPAPPQARHQP